MGIGAFEEAAMVWDGGAMLGLAIGRTILLVEVEGGMSRVQVVTEEARNFLAANADLARRIGGLVHA